MGRYPSPLVNHELSRLDYAGGRDVALNALKCCVQQLGPDSIAYFLHQIAIAHHHVPRPYVISLYEDVARVHRSLLVPYIPKVMEALVCALSDSGSSHRVHDACAKVVVGISIYCIEPDSADQARDVLRLLCQPLLCSLSSNFEPLAAGSALCIKALVQSRNWGKAAVELVDQVFSGLASALRGKSIRTPAHLQLACLLVTKGKRDFMQRYVLHLLNSGKDILQAPSSTWTLRVGAAQLLNAAMRVMDGLGYRSEIQSVVEILEKYRLDSMRKVRLAVAEALKTAKKCCAHGSGISSTDMLLAVGAAVSKKPCRPVHSSRLFHVGHSSLLKKQPEIVSFLITEPEKRWPNVKNKAAEPCGDLIQEWIKVHNGFPSSLATLDVIDEGLEYEELEEALNKQYMSLTSERAAQGMDSTSTLDVLKEESSARPPEEQNTSESEWSVRNNPIATKNNSTNTKEKLKFQKAEIKCSADRQTKAASDKGRIKTIEVMSTASPSEVKVPDRNAPDGNPSEQPRFTRITLLQRDSKVELLENSQENNFFGHLKQHLDLGIVQQRDLDLLQQQEELASAKVYWGQLNGDAEENLDVLCLKPEYPGDQQEQQIFREHKEDVKVEDELQRSFREHLDFEVGNQQQQSFQEQPAEDEQDRQRLQRNVEAEGQFGLVSQQQQSFQEQPAEDEQDRQKLQRNVEAEGQFGSEYQQEQQHPQQGFHEQQPNCHAADKQRCLEDVGTSEISGQEQNAEVKNQHDSSGQDFSAEDKQQENQEQQQQQEIVVATDPQSFEKVCRRDVDAVQQQSQHQVQQDHAFSEQEDSDKQWFGAESDFSDADPDSDAECECELQAPWCRLSRVFYRGRGGFGQDVATEEEDEEEVQEVQQGWSCSEVVERGWYGLQCGVEVVLGGSACALVAFPALMAVLKYLEQSSCSSDCCCYYHGGASVPT